MPNCRYTIKDCADAPAIALPNQNPLDRALQAPSGEPITSNGLVLDEVLLRFRHPNAGARREAIGGLKEILLQQPQREVGKVTRVLGGSISDEVNLHHLVSSEDVFGLGTDWAGWECTKDSTELLWMVYPGS